MAQHLVVVVGVLKAHVPELDLALAHHQGPGVRRVGDGDRRVHDLQEALDAGHAPLELLGKFHDAADGGDQRRYIEHIGHQIAGLDGAVDQGQTARQDDHQVHQAVEQPGGGVERRHGVVGQRLDILKRVVALGKFFPFLLLGGKSLHHPLAQQAVLDGGVQLADLEPLLPEPGAEFQVQIHRDHAHQRHAGKNDQGQRHAGLTQNKKGRRDLDEGNEELFRAVVGELSHVEQVVGDAAHDLADLGVVVVGVVQPQQMVEGVAAHVGLDVYAHDVADAGHEIAGGAVDDAQHEVERGQPQHGLHGQRRRLAGGRVGQRAHDLGQHDVAQGGQRRAEQIEKQDAFVLHQVGQKTPQQLFAAFLLGHEREIPHFFIERLPGRPARQRPPRCGGGLSLLKTVKNPLPAADMRRRRQHIQGNFTANCVGGHRPIARCVRKVFVRRGLRTGTQTH